MNTVVIDVFKNPPRSPSSPRPSWPIDRTIQSIEKTKRRSMLKPQNPKSLGDFSMDITLTVTDLATDPILRIRTAAASPLYIPVGIEDKTIEPIKGIRDAIEKELAVPIPLSLSIGGGLLPITGSPLGIMLYSGDSGSGSDGRTPSPFGGTEDSPATGSYAEKSVGYMDKIIEKAFDSAIKKLFPQESEFPYFMDSLKWNTFGIADSVQRSQTEDIIAQKQASMQSFVKLIMTGVGYTLGAMLPSFASQILTGTNIAAAALGNPIADFFSNMDPQVKTQNTLDGYEKIQDSKQELSKYADLVTQRGNLIRGLYDGDLEGQERWQAEGKLREVDEALKEMPIDDPMKLTELLDSRVYLGADGRFNAEALEKQQKALYHSLGFQQEQADYQMGKLMGDISPYADQFREEESAMRVDLLDKQEKYEKALGESLDIQQLRNELMDYNLKLEDIEARGDKLNASSLATKDNAEMEKLKSDRKAWIEDRKNLLGEIEKNKEKYESAGILKPGADLKDLEGVSDAYTAAEKKYVEASGVLEDAKASYDSAYLNYLQGYQSRRIQMEHEGGYNPELLASSYWLDKGNRDSLGAWFDKLKEIQEQAPGLRMEDKFQFDQLISALVESMPKEIRENLSPDMDEIKGDGLHAQVLQHAYAQKQSSLGDFDLSTFFPSDVSYGLPTTGYMLPSMMGYGYPMGLGMMGMGLPTDSESVMELQRSLRDKGYGGLLGGFGVNGDGVDGLLGPYTMNAAMTMFQDSLKSFFFGESTPPTLPTGTAPYYGQLGSDPSGKPLSDPTGTYQGGLFDQFSALSSATGTLTDCFSSCSNSFSSFGSSLGSARSAVDSFSSKLYAFQPPSYGGGSGKPGSTGGGSTPAIFRAADGGFLDEPKYLLAGEAGPEAIIPLSQERRARGLDLWLDAGQRMGVSPYADESTIHSGLSPAPSSESSGGGRAPINVTMNFSIDPATDASSLVASLRENMPAIANDVAEAIASSLEQTYSNMPLSYSR